MQGIGPVSGAQRAGLTTPATGGAAKPSGAKGEFGKTLMGYIEQANGAQQDTAGAVKDLISGKADVVSVVSSMAKADLSFKLLMGVRNKVIEAYKQTMNMQI
jgi:flagellar hook-basal body complex protein FliE